MKTYIYIIFIIIFTACKSTSQQKKSNYSDRFNIIIEDYCLRNQENFKNFNFFRINYENVENGGYYFYSILPIKHNTHAYSIDADPNPNLSYLPSDYVKFKGKVFLINDKNVVTIKEGLLEYLDSEQLLDSTRVKLQLGMIQEEDLGLRMDLFDDSLEGVNYIICKNKPYTIRMRIRSRSYILPNDKRFENKCE